MGHLTPGALAGVAVVGGVGEGGRAFGLVEGEDGERGAVGVADFAAGERARVDGDRVDDAGEVVALLPAAVADAEPVSRH